MTSVTTKPELLPSSSDCSCRLFDDWFDPIDAARLILDRIAPVRRGRAVHLKMPELGDGPSVMNAHAALLGDVASGKVTPEKAEPVSAMLGTHLKTIETVDIDRRLREVESKLDRK
jgi:hypothetical protein